jgi:hypothetical protein
MGRFDLIEDRGDRMGRFDLIEDRGDRMGRFDLIEVTTWAGLS